MLVLGFDGTMMLFLVELVLGLAGAGLGVDFAIFTSSHLNLYATKLTVRS